MARKKPVMIDTIFSVSEEVRHLLDVMAGKHCRANVPRWLVVACRDIIAHSGGVLVQMIEARALAADALRYGLEEADRLRDINQLTLNSRNWNRRKYLEVRADNHRLRRKCNRLLQRLRLAEKASQR